METPVERSGWLIGILAVGCAPKPGMWAVYEVDETCSSIDRGDTFRLSNPEGSDWSFESDTMELQCTRDKGGLWCDATDSYDLEVWGIQATGEATLTLMLSSSRFGRELSGSIAVEETCLGEGCLQVPELYEGCSSGGQLSAVWAN